MSTKVLICIPTYNEAKNILEIVRRWDTVLSSYQNTEGEILIIDDNCWFGYYNVKYNFDFKEF